MKKIIITIFATFALCVLVVITGCGGDKLSAPENLNETDLVLSWDAVEGADGYAVFIDGKEFFTENNRFDFKTLPLKTEFNVKIKAVLKDKRKDSDYAEYLLKVTSPVSSGYDEKGYYFTLTEDGSGYALSKGNADITGIMMLPDKFCGLPVVEIKDHGFDGSAKNDEADVFSEKFCNDKTQGFILPSFLRYVGKNAFSYNIRVEKIEIPDGVTEIDEGAFYGCKRLKTVKLSKNLKQIKDKAFACCALRSLNFPDGLEVIGKSAFDALIDETAKVKNFTEQILSEITLPDSVKILDDYAFRGCYNLQKVKMHYRTEYVIGKDVFSYTSVVFGLTNCSRITVLYKEINNRSYNNRFYFGSSFVEQERFDASEKESYGLGLYKTLYVTLSSYAFARLKELKTIELGDYCMLAGSFIFADCTALETVTVSPVLKIFPESIFDGCVSLKSIILPEETTTVSENAFRNCSALKYVVAPKTVSSLASSAFDGCKALDTLFFYGTAEEYETVKQVFLASDELTFAKVYFYSRGYPTDEGDFWRYVDGEPVIW